MTGTANGADRAQAWIARQISLGRAPCPAPPMAPGRRGAVAWSKMLHWCLTSGSSVRERYGVYTGRLGSPHQLTVRVAVRNYLCAGEACRHIITRGRLHGSTYYDHYCPCCITLDRPEDQFIPGGSS